jgi:hypothetical protein
MRSDWSISSPFVQWLKAASPPSWSWPMIQGLWSLAARQHDTYWTESCVPMRFTRSWYFPPILCNWSSRHADMYSWWRYSSAALGTSFFSPGKEPLVHLVQENGRAPKPVTLLRRKTISLSLPGTKTRFLGPAPPRSLVSVFTCSNYYINLELIWTRRSSVWRTSPVRWLQWERVSVTVSNIA